MADQEHRGRRGKERSRHFRWAMALLAGGLMVVFSVLCFPPFGMAEAAYVCVLPMLVWACTSPGRKLYGVTALLASWLLWFLILIWLRHIHPPWGWLATALLSFLVGLFPAAWFMVSREVLPRVLDMGTRRRLLVLLGLAGLWVVLEWTRTWLFTGFPWLPLAASQWERPALLQLAAWTGQYGVSFVLIFFNLGLLFYGRNLMRNAGRRGKQPKVTIPSRKTFPTEAGAPTRVGSGLRLSFCPEFYVGLAMLLGCFYLYVRVFHERGEREPMFRAVAVQPWVPALLKWEPGEAMRNLESLERLTAFAALVEPRPELILWPEAATPYPILHEEDSRMLRWTERLVNEAGIPLLAGSLAVEGDALYNGVFLIEPEKGLHETYYFKRHPVPFGEYTPMRGYLPFVNKVVPLENDISPGGDSTIIPVETNSGNWPVGFMICNEDIYPRLARDMARAGATWLLIVTNDAWYGQEGGAYQHAAHSVLRAVETRLPVVRCGNHGWTGWIDEYGQIREVLTDGDGSIYFRGAGPLNVSRWAAPVGSQSFYTRYGDWFVGLSLLLGLGIWPLLWLVRREDSGESE